MPMRLSGLMSGMDTESIISQLVEVRKVKVDKAKKSQKSINYKQEAWKGLNTKLQNLQNKFISNMRFTSSFMKKATKVSNPNAVSVITGENAVNGVQSLRVDSLAKTAYLTGAKLGEDTSYTALSTMENLGVEFDEEGKGVLTVANKTNSLDIEITKDTTISDVLDKLKEFGLNASFDEKNQRLFISAKESGANNDFTISGSSSVIDKLGLNTEVGQEDGSGATKVAGKDAVIYLNDAKFTNSNNVFNINGLTFTALSETKAGEEVTITTQDDTDGIYDMIKNFVKEYNSVINEMDKLYNAADSKLEPLTDEEKDAMSDREVEDWEKKINDSILRRDENLGDIASALKSIMSAGVEVGGEKLYLSDFGINTLSYFSSADNEKNAYHIDGDSDDSSTAGNADVLKGLIASDPNKVISFFTGLSQNLYSKMSDMSKSVDGKRTFGTFYDDKKMKADYTEYNSKIKELEAKLNAYEDSWYKKFSKMETAMAKMQSNTSAVTAMLGGQ